MRDWSRVRKPWDEAFEQDAQKYPFLNYAIACWYIHMEDETNTRDPKDIWIDVLQTVARGLAKIDARFVGGGGKIYVRDFPLAYVINDDGHHVPRETLYGQGREIKPGYIDEETGRMRFPDIEAHDNDNPLS